MELRGFPGKWWGNSSIFLYYFLAGFWLEKFPGHPEKISGRPEKFSGRPETKSGSFPAKSPPLFPPPFCHVICCADMASLGGAKLPWPQGLAFWPPSCSVRCILSFICTPPHGVKSSVWCFLPFLTSLHVWPALPTYESHSSSQS